MSERRSRDGLGTWLVLAAFWVVALVFCLGSLTLLDDHFGRISPGRQILVFGDLPFRDFLDPGYFLTEFSSAAVQWLFGQNLLGELLLNAVFIATGSLLVCVLARRVSGSLAVAIVAGILALSAAPRAYDYDKVLFYPLGIWMAWRWLEAPRARQLILLAPTLTFAGLYRYDNAAFLGIAILVGVAVATWAEPRELLTRAVLLIVAAGIISAPALLFIETHGGIGNAIDQSISYGVRERNRTHLSSLPRVSLGSRVVGMIDLPPSQNMVRVRWAPSVASGEQRDALATRFGLEAEQQDGPVERRTWRYLMPDPSTDRIRQLVNDPAVEDTDGIDRSSLVLSHPESRLIRLQRTWPLLRVRVAPDLWTGDNAQSILYYLVVLLPIVSLIVLARRWSTESRVDRGGIALVIALCVLLDVFILRDPFMARVGGIAGPPALLAAWLFPRCCEFLARPSRRPLIVSVRAAATVVLVVLVWSFGTALDWPHQVNDLVSTPASLSDRLKQFARQPPDLGLLPSGHLAGMVQYLRRCTQPADRVFISWFRPELFYFAQRGFGGGMSATFGGHWSEPRFEQRSIAAFESEPTPLVVLRVASAGEFQTQYSQLTGYLARRYEVAGETDFGDTEAGPRAYRVLVRRDRQPASQDQATGLPCFAQ